MKASENEITLESIKLEHAKIGQMIAEFEALAQKPEPLICAFDGYEYYLGPQAPEQMAWADAIEWCKSLGEDYELPTRIVLLACYANTAIRQEFDTDDWYWASTDLEFTATNAWKQTFSNGYQATNTKATASSVRAVRKVLI